MTARGQRFELVDEVAQVAGRSFGHVSRSYDGTV
jgi:hypothetical protein